MRPRYVIVVMAIVAAAAVVALGPLRGRSVEDGFGDIATTLSGASAPSSQTPNAASPAPEITVSQPVVRKSIEWDEYTGRFDAVEAVDVRARVSGT